MNFSEALQKSINSCAKPYYKHKKRIERENRPRRDYSYCYRPYVKTLKDYLYEVFPEAYEIASGGGKFTPMVRQLYYVVRRLLQEKGCDKDLEDAYHRTTLEEYEKQIGRRLCYRKAVGNMIEPHGICPTCGYPSGCDLGTQGVDSYVVPQNRFNKILYVEKTGFMSQLLQENIHNKYDIAIAAGSGFSPQAAKELFAKIEKNIPVKIYCLHDADISGIEIARTLGDKLVHENYSVNVIDLGLTPQEAIDLYLPSEKVDIMSKPSWELKKRVTDRELEWLLGEDMRDCRLWRGRRRVLYRGNRVELNAFTPEQFIGWVEKKLQDLEFKKVIPEEEIIEKFTRDAYIFELTKMVIEKLIQRPEVQKIIQDASKKGLKISSNDIQNSLEDDLEINWEKAISDKVKRGLKELNIESLIIRCKFLDRNYGRKEKKRKKKVEMDCKNLSQNKTEKEVHRNVHEDMKNHNRIQAGKITKQMMDGDDLQQIIRGANEIIKDLFGKDIWEITKGK